MPRLINTNEISWKVWTLGVVIGGAGALGGSFYAGKYVGSQPPTVIRVPPRRVPIPVGVENMPVLQGEAQASPTTSPASGSRPNRFKADSHAGFSGRTIPGSGHEEN
jgi:hypothetical protein